MNRRALAAVGLLVAVLSGCDGQGGSAAGGPSTEAPSTQDTPDGSPSAEAPPQFLGRTPLPACSPVELRQGETLPSSARACLDEGWTGEGAELRVTAPSAEGIPFVTYHRVLPGAGGYEVFTDGTADVAFGSGAWEYSSCPRAVSVDDLGPCTYTELT